MTKQLYPEQQEARYISNTMLNAKISSVFVSPCGTGKTFTTTVVIGDRIGLGKRLFVLVPQLEIMNQWVEELSEAGLNPGYVNDEGMKGKDRAVYVCMYQSLVGMLSLIPESLYPDEIIIDETQHILCSSIKTICTHFGNATRLGLTATLYHNSGESFRPWFTEFFQTITKRKAIENHYITEPIPIVPEDYLKDADIPDLGKEYDMNKQAEALGKTRIIGDMVETYERLFNGNPVIIPCATFQQSKEIKEMFCKSGWNFEHVHSDGMSKSDRKRILSGISSQKINGLCTVGIGVEGLSIRGLWGVMWACRTKSPIRWTQFNGRAERIYEGKRYALIVDFVGNTIIHGHPSDERRWDLEGEEIKEEIDMPAMKRCPDCGVYNAQENTECHWCGADLTDEGKLPGTCRRCKHWKDGCMEGLDSSHWLTNEGCLAFQKRGRSLPAMIDGELVAITTDGEKHALKERVQKRKEDIVEMGRIEEEERVKLEEVPMVSKLKKIQEDLFSDPIDRSMFKDALNNWAEG